MPNSFGVGSSGSCFVITPSDTENLSNVTRGIFIGGSGNINVLLVDDTIPIIWKNLVQGELYPRLAELTE